MQFPTCILALCATVVGLAFVTKLIVMAYLKQDKTILTIETDREVDGRWIAEIVELPGVMTYGVSALEAITKAKMLATTVLKHSDRSEPYFIVRSRRRYLS